MIAVFVQALTPIILLAGLGILLSRKTQYLDSPQLGALVSNIGIPALLLHSILNMKMELSGMLSLVAVTIVILVLVGVASFVFLKLLGLPVRFYLPPLVNPNTGNLGTPVAYALFGVEGLTVAIVVSSVVQISHFTLGVGFMSGSYHPKQLVKNGPVLALIVGGVFSGMQLSLPEAVMNTLGMLSAITLPIMLMLLGKSLASLSINDKSQIKRVVSLSLFRPLIGSGVALLVVPFFNFNSVETATIVMLHGMSVAVISYMLATRFDGPKDEIALMIMLSLPVSLGVAGGVWWWFQ
ncbi:AEC family transporter [Rhodanobacter aciditrophus]|uniref:AEC family transporter n=1 Tax=Rhodanobacter aciditrophus TaxID=1623218 RepID=A0ABW4B0U3_9GAMM